MVTREGVAAKRFYPTPWTTDVSWAVMMKLTPTEHHKECEGGEEPRPIAAKDCSCWDKLVCTAINAVWADRIARRLNLIEDLFHELDDRAG